MSRPANRWHIQRLRKAQLRPPGIGEPTTTEPNNNEHNDSNDIDDVDDSLPGAYAISNNEHQIPLWDSNDINTSTIDQLLHNETSTNNDNMQQNDDDIPNWLDLNQDYVIVQQSERHGLRTNKKTVYTSLSIFMILSVIAIVSTIIVTQMNTHHYAETFSVCYLDKKEMVQCQYDFLQVPSCANTTFQKLAMDLLNGNHSHPYPCDSRHFGLVAIAVAQVNEKDPIDDILQYWIMAIIYFSLGGPDWRIDQNWLTGKSPCHTEWYGIACSKQNHIEKIELLSNNVVGSLPLEITKLTSMQVLNLFMADISGTIASEIGRLRLLAKLNLRSTSLVGTLPTEIGLCKNLESLDLSYLELSGMVPTEIGSLSNLTSLGLPSNVGGMLPTEVGLLFNLREFDLINMMNLRVTLMYQLGHFSSLSSLRILSGFEGDIMFSSFLSCLPSNLELLHLRGSSFTGQIPTDLSLFVHLTSLTIIELRLTGTLPTEIGLLTKLQSLTISGTSLRGYIPSEIGKLTHLGCLDLTDNKFSKSEVSNLVTVNKIAFCN